MRYAYALTGALLLSATAATMTINPIAAAGAQTAQNDPAAMASLAPRAGAPLSFADLVARLQPAVVNISTKQSLKVRPQANPFAGTPFEQFFNGAQGGGDGRPITQRAQSLGSGFIISPDGYVVTNNHVVAPGAEGATVDSITVTLVDGKEYTAKLVGRDQASDLALLKINATNLPFVRWGDSTKARVGDWIVAIGNPFGIGSTVTAGIVSALHRATDLGGNERFIQTDAAINQGNSGGPMFDLSGNVIGINSQIYTPSQGSVGIGFAIPSEQAKPVIDTLMKGQSVKRGYLGVQLQPLDEDAAAAVGLKKNEGEIVGSVVAGQPADKAGVKPGDIIVRVNGQQVTVDTTVSYITARTAPGTPIKLDVLRQGRPVTLTVIAGTRPSEDALAKLGTPEGNDVTPSEQDKTDNKAMSDSLGLELTTLTPQIAAQIGVPQDTKGVVVVSVDPSSDAAQKSLQRGDIISSVNQQPVASVSDVVRAISQARAAKRDSVLVLVQRGPTTKRYIGLHIN